MFMPIDAELTVEPIESACCTRRGGRRGRSRGNVGRGGVAVVAVDGAQGESVSCT